MQEENNNNQKEGEKQEGDIVEVIENEKTEDIFAEGENIDDIIESETDRKSKQTYLAIIILLLGALLGSLFVDMAQFLASKGYSPKALKEARVFSLDEKTWVAYDEPIVKLNILTVSDEESKDCPTCKPPKEVVDLFEKVMPTLDIKEVDINSVEGKKLVEKYNVKVVPSLIFSDELEQTEFYNGEAKVLFAKMADDQEGYNLNLTALGLPIGKYIETPTFNEDNPMIGDKDAPIKIILFSDHQCPFCAKFFNEIIQISKEFGDKTVLVYKDLPLDFHPQAMNAAIAGECAKDQDKFWEMSGRLYSTQKQWGNLQDDKAKGFFKKQAQILRLDMEKFDACLENGEHKDFIEKSKQEAESFGIGGTPSLFINDEFLPGVVPADKLREIIQAQLDKLTGENEKETEIKDEEKKAE